MADAPAYPAARDSAPGDDSPLDKPSGIRRILILLEDRGPAQSAVVEGLELARVHAAEVLFVHAIPHDVVPSVDLPIMAVDSGEILLHALQEQSQQLLASAQRAARKAGISARGISMAAGQAGREIAQLADAQACDMIVVATEGRNAVVRLMSGSVIPGLITAATVPVLICRDASEPLLGGTRRRRRKLADDAEATEASRSPPD